MKITERNLYTPENNFFVAFQFRHTATTRYHISKVLKVILFISDL